MDLTVSETQQMLADTARDVLGKHASYDVLREMNGSPSGFDDALWKRMVEVGWTELPFVDADTTDLGHLAVLLREFGRAALGSPYFQSVVAAGLVVHRLGDVEAAAGLVERIGAGAQAALAAPADPSAIAMARADGDGYLVRGGPFLVEWATLAETLVCPAALEDGTVVLLALARETPGVRVEELSAIDDDRIGRIELDGVRVGGSGVLTSTPLPAADLERELALVRLLRAVEMSGGTEFVLETTVDYVRARHQFGKPLGAFQAVQHMCADMAMESDGAMLSTWEAVSLAEQGVDFLDRAAIATYVAGRAYERVTQTAAQLHGGMGFMAEYHLQFYFRRAKAQRQRLGSTRFQLEFVARHVVDPTASTGRFPTRTLVVAET